ncbi:competence protein ComK [Marinococcus luteus]|uniref:competence protein ComK n=1 Tax=Marinococcus luteus TaxID=1122204 RepID=UPI002ACC7236|nr:competence protein ComK [Marinococcus luteus]MDZ5784094.1 competence protein ComK [Marinococcus luteus]
MQKTIILDEYEVNENTMAIVPNFEGEAKSIIWEKDGARIPASCTPTAIIKRGCLRGGSSFEGRSEAVKHYLHIRKKLPVPVNPSEGIYAFPISSLRDPENIWIFYNHVQPGQFVTSDDGTLIQFTDGTSLPTKASTFMIQQQLFRTGHCQSMFTA